MPIQPTNSIGCKLLAVVRLDYLIHPTKRFLVAQERKSIAILYFVERNPKAALL